MQPTKASLQITILLAAAFLIVGTVPASASARGEFERTLKVSGTVNLQVETGSGSIDVRTGTSNEVHVVGHIRANEWFGDNAEERVRRLESNPPIQQSGNDIRIGHIDNPELKRNISISYEVIVPASTELRAASGSGNETISGISGSLEASTGSGGLELHNLHGSLQAQAGSGDIKAEGEATGSWTVHTGSGSVQLRLPQNASFNLNAHTGSGSINLSHPVTVQGSIGRKEVRGKVGGGGVPVEVQTGSGNILIE